MADKRVVEVRELQEIQKRTKGLLCLSIILTLLVITYLFLRVLLPEIWGQINIASIGLFSFASLTLTLGQLQMLRYLESSSRKKLSKLIFQDELTGLNNYRYIERILDSEVARAKRFSSPLSLIYIDIDNFKKVNDLFGHTAGNEVLSQIGKFLNNSIRDIDIVGRIGGDEFLIILPLSTIDEALSIADRLKGKFSSRTFKLTTGEKVELLTLSLGVISTPPLPPEKETLIKEADRAMYRAKRESGNKTSL